MNADEMIRAIDSAERKAAHEEAQRWTAAWHRAARRCGCWHCQRRLLQRYQMRGD